MLYDGPWAQSIVAFEPNMPAAFAHYWAIPSRSTNQRARPSRAATAVDVSPALASPSARRPDGAFGVEVGGQIPAVALYSLCGTAAKKRNMHLLIGVAKDYRRKGMGTALLRRCTAVARQAGLRYLVIEDIDAGALRIAYLTSADLIFNNGECQGWIDLSPLTPITPKTALADVRHA